MGRERCDQTMWFSLFLSILIWSTPTHAGCFGKGADDYRKTSPILKLEYPQLDGGSEVESFDPETCVKAQTPDLKWFNARGDTFMLCYTFDTSLYLLGVFTPEYVLLALFQTNTCDESEIPGAITVYETRTGHHVFLARIPIPEERKTADQRAAETLTECHEYRVSFGSGEKLDVAYKLCDDDPKLQCTNPPDSAFLQYKLRMTYGDGLFKNGWKTATDSYGIQTGDQGGTGQGTGQGTQGQTEITTSTSPGGDGGGAGGGGGTGGSTGATVTNVEDANPGRFQKRTILKRAAKAAGIAVLTEAALRGLRLACKCIFEPNTSCADQCVPREVGQGLTKAALESCSTEIIKALCGLS